MPFRQKSSRAELMGWLAIRKLLVAGIVRFYVSLALPASRRALYLASPRSVPMGCAWRAIGSTRGGREGRSALLLGVCCYLRGLYNLSSRRRFGVATV